jgi:peptidoglycan-N-acetylglucosamine deacetylase
MDVAITIDMEHDCPPFLDTYRGVTGGTPRLLELFAQREIHATFFTTGDVARRFPDTVRQIVDAGHELGCHGDTHRRFSTLDPKEAKREIDDASAVLRTFYPVTSFRAPNLDFPRSYVPFLRDAKYTHDSSLGRHKQGSYFIEPHVQDQIKRVPASISPSVVRLPRPVRHQFFSRFRDPVVLFFHPWEFVDMWNTKIPIDCRFGTGDWAVKTLDEAIGYFKQRGGQFKRMRELPA